MEIFLLSLAVQTTVTFLVAGLFWFLFKTYARQYFAYWTRAWVLLAIGQGLLFLTLLPGVHLAKPVSFGHHSLVGLGALLLVLGGLNFHHGRVPTLRDLLLWGGLVLLYAGFSTAWTGSYRQALIPRWVGLGGAFLFLSYRFLSTRGARSGRGAQLLGGSFGVWGFQQLHYLFIFSLPAEGAVPGYVRHLGFVDALIEVMVAAGMVILLMEESQQRLQAANQETRELAQRYRAVVEGGNEGIVMVDPEERILFSNRKFEVMLGYPEGALMGRSLFELLAEGEAERLRQEMVRRRQGEATAYELIFQSSTGRKIHTLVSGTPVLGERGQFLGSFGFISDITRLKHTEAQAQKRAAHLTLLQAVTREVSSVLEPERLLKDVVEFVRQTFGYRHVVLLMREDDSEELVLGAQSGEFVAFVPPGYRQRVGEGIVGAVVSSGQAILLNDVRMDLRYKAVVPGVLSELCVPIKLEGEVIGALNIESDQPGAFEAVDQEVMETLAEEVAIAIQNARLYREEKKRVQEANTLLEIAKVVSSTLELEEVLKLIAQRTAKACEVDRCSIFLWDEKKERVMPVMSQLASGVPDERLEQQFIELGGSALEGVPFLKATIERSEPVVVENPGESPLVPPGWAERLECKALFSVPLIHQDQVMGTLILDYMEQARPFTPGQLKLAQTVASQVALVIDNARLFKRVHEEAIHDALTGLYNHRFFQRRLQEEVKRAARRERPLTLLFCDLDRFKDFNDTHGHLLGDEVLRGVAEIIHQSTRGTDLPARYGGEEFTILLPETDGVEGFRVAERIRAGMEARLFRGQAGRSEQLTISIGIAVYPEDASEPMSLVQAADEALLRAKAEGRNRVVRGNGRDARGGAAP